MVDVAVFRALGDVNRLRVLQLLFDGELCVCQVEKLLDMSQPNVSRHLHKLRTAGLVEADRRGQWTYYRLSAYMEKQGADLVRYLQSNTFQDPLFVQDRMLMHQARQEDRLICDEETA